MADRNDSCIIKEDGLTKQQIKNRRKREAAKKKKLEKKQLQNGNDESVKTSEKPDQSNGEEIVDNFEEELCWCIQQIELGMQTQKPTPDQVTKSRKLITQLRSNKTLKPKKRMLMKTNFGNYRESMTRELKMPKVTPAKIVEVDEKTIQKSVFVKKKMNDDMPPSLSCEAAHNNNKFLFNFPDPT